MSEKLRLTIGQRVALEELERLQNETPTGVKGRAWLEAVADRFGRNDMRRSFSMTALERHGLAEVRRVRFQRSGSTPRHSAWLWFITARGRQAIGASHEVAA